LFSAARPSKRTVFEQRDIGQAAENKKAKLLG